MEVLASPTRKVHLISLGCARNRADSEVMLGSLMSNNYSITDDAEEADTVVINTCGFIEAAKAESVQTILDAAEL
ncbi:MAG: 30S ribosomal protein S12 methylthiotransferase RimO, partial [Proteobacteria bacterium]